MRSRAIRGGLAEAEEHGDRGGEGGEAESPGAENRAEHGAGEDEEFQGNGWGGGTASSSSAGTSSVSPALRGLFFFSVIQDIYLANP